MTNRKDLMDGSHTDTVVCMNTILGAAAALPGHCSINRIRDCRKQGNVRNNFLLLICQLKSHD